MQTVDMHKAISKTSHHFIPASVTFPSRPLDGGGREVELAGIYVTGSAHLGQLVVRCLHKKQQTPYFINTMSIAQYKLKLERAEDIIA
jgi:hypothetical protein